MLRANPAWLVAAVPAGLVCVNGATEVKVACALSPVAEERLIGLLSAGIDVRDLARVADASEDEAREMLELLARQGVLHARPPRAPTGEGVALVETLLAVTDGMASAASVSWTATEVLILPRGLSLRLARRAVRGFVAGLPDDARLAAYCHVASTGRRTVVGDAPDPHRLSEAVAAARADPDAVHVADLEAGERITLVPDEVDALDAHRPHRLGPVLSVATDPTRRLLRGERAAAVARHAVANLRYADEARERSTHGVGRSAQHAQLVARAEAIERYAVSDVAGQPLVRRRHAQLEGAVAPTEQCRLSARQYAERPELDPYEPDEAYLWTPATARDGSRRWLVAETVYGQFLDERRPRRLPWGSSSGVAAHTSFAEARARALCELVERDAFMWTWLQRVSRERIERRTLPDAVADLAARIERAGLRVDFVNLTLELHPVILCAIHGESSLDLGAACHPQPAAAAGKALEEAANMFEPADRSARQLEAEDVRQPTDHRSFYQDPGRVAEAAFLFSSAESISLAEVETEAEPLEERLATVGEPLTIDLSSTVTRPFRVVRAVVPGLVPITFGLDREPLGMPRAAEPKLTAGGRTLGAALDLASVRLDPHPFA